MGKLLLSFAVVFIFAASTAMAQPRCNEKDIVHEYLAEKFQEVPTSAGVTSTGRLLEVLSNKGGSWTIIVTSPQGLSCLIAEGEGWRGMEQVSTDPEA